MSVPGGANCTPDPNFKSPLLPNESPRITQSDNESTTSSVDAGKFKKVTRKTSGKSLLNSLAVYKGYCDRCKTLYSKCQDKTTRDQLRDSALAHLREKHSQSLVTKTPPIIVTAIENDPPNLNFPKTTLPEDPNKITLQEQKQLLDIMDVEEQQKAEKERAEKRKRTESSPEEASKLAKLLEKRCFPTIPTRNRYEPLSDTEPDNTDYETDVTHEEIANKTRRTFLKPPTQTPVQQKQTKIQQKTGPPRPPPFILAGITSSSTTFKQLTQQIKDATNKKFAIKFTKNNTIIQFDDLDDYKTYKKKLEANKDLDWHTYSTAEEKTHAFIVRGLDHLPEPEEIKEELESTYKIKVKQIHPMKTSFRPLYMVVTATDLTLQQLKKIRYLSYVHVTWERRRTTTKIIQCRRCCQWGHATTNCYRQHKCMYCAGNHQAKNCTSKDGPRKCVNCNKQHPANAQICNVYKFKLDKMNEALPQQQQKRYTEAPTPKENAWMPRVSGPSVGTGRAPNVIQRRQQAQPAENSARNSVNKPHNVNNVNIVNNTCDSDSDYNTAYPPLKPRGGQANNQNLNINNNTKSGTIAEAVSDLMAANREFQKFVNIKELTRLMRDLTQVAKSAKDKMERALALVDFLTDRLDGYSI